MCNKFIIKFEKAKTSYQYDKNSQLTAVTDALDRITSMTYDGDGNRTTITDRENRSISYTYDLLDRVIGTQSGAGEETTTTKITYDSVGNVESTTKENFFYVKEGTENEKQPNNIAVGVGKNLYSAEEHEQFKDAIMRQMAKQLTNYKGVTLTAAGTNTANGDVVYLFMVTEEDTGLVTNQYYIIGEKKYCLIQESNFDGSKESNEVTKKIVDIFKWAK